jgi:hypothetical protein
MIDVQVSQQDDVGICKSKLRFSETGKGARAGVDEYSRYSIEEQEVTRCGSSRGSRAAGTQYGDTSGGVWPLNATVPEWHTAGGKNVSLFL